MAKKFSPLASIKASGMSRQQAFGGVQTLYAQYRVQRFYGTKAQVQQVMAACGAAGFAPELIPNTHGIKCSYLDGDRHITFYDTSLTYETPKESRQFNQSLYD